MYYELFYDDDTQFHITHHVNLKPEVTLVRREYFFFFLTNWFGGNFKTSYYGCSTLYCIYILQSHTIGYSSRGKRASWAETHRPTQLVYESIYPHKNAGLKFEFIFNSFLYVLKQSIFFLKQHKLFNLYSFNSVHNSIQFFYT